MICSKCGALLQEGCVYCSQCGQEAQIVSELNILEDDLLRELMAERERAEAENLAAQEHAAKKKQERRREEKRREKKKQKTRRKLLIFLILVIVLLGAFLGIRRYRTLHSVPYLLTDAQTEYNQKNYQSALAYLEEVLAAEPENGAAISMKAAIYAAMKDYDTAESLYLSLLELYPDSVAAYEGLISIYQATGQMDKLLALRAQTTDEEILALFEGKVLAEPVLSVESGDYASYFDVEITTSDENLVIYYTLDGTTPTSESLLYEEAVEIAEQGTITLTAVCMDADGNYSDTVSAVYEIALDRPDKPTASPDGGQFTSATTVTITVPEGCTVYYTWDGSTPTTGSSRYSTPLEVPEGNHILSLIAVDAYGMVSEVQKCNFIYYPNITAADEAD